MNEYKLKSGNILRVEQDINAESPNTWSNEDMFLVYEHRDFTVKREGFIPDIINEYLQDDPNERSMEFDDYYIFPVDAYIHSGVHLSLSDTESYPDPDRRWDVSTTGFVLVKKEKELSEDKAKEYAEGLLETWNQYLSGDVYGFTVLKPIETYTITEEELSRLRIGFDQDDPDATILYREFLDKAVVSTEHKELDSCWGFYGSDPKENGILDHIDDELIT